MWIRDQLQFLLLVSGVSLSFFIWVVGFMVVVTLKGYCED